MQTIAFLGVQCLSCKSWQIASVAESLVLGEPIVPHPCACHVADAPVERAALVMQPAEGGAFTFEMVFASAAYVAAIIGMVTGA